MKRLLLCFSVLVLNGQLFAQTDFCVPGARWIYEDLGTAQNPPNQLHVIYLGDTIIDGYTDVHVLKTEDRTNWFDLWSNYQEFRSYSRKSNDSVFQLIDDSFEFMFDFDVQGGDTRVVYIGGGFCSQYDTMLVISTGSMEYNGEQLRTYDYRLLVEDQIWQNGVYGYSGVYQGRYVERIGLLVDHPINNRFYCDGGVTEYQAANFVCYTDDELAINYPDTCNLFLDVLVEESLPASIISFQNQLHIQNVRNSTLRIYDILGKELYSSTVRSDNEVIDITHLPNGILMIVVEGLQAPITKKILKPN